MRFWRCAWLCGVVSLAVVQICRAAGPDVAITDFSAIGDGKHVNTKEIQAAIDHAAASGGGVIVVPAGTFVSGAIFFKQGVDLRVDKGGVLKGSTNPDDYPQIPTRWEGEERVWTSAFVNFDHMTDVTISGDGTIDGSGDAWMQRGGRFGRRFGATRPTTRVAAARGPATRPYGNLRGRPRLICVSNCQRVNISDLRLRRQAVWCLHLLYSQDVTVKNVSINAMGLIPSSDGIDVDSCNGVAISHCDIACDDDDISVKSGKDADGARVNRPSENITISDCTIGEGGGIAMGSEVTGGVRHVLVERCVFNGTDASARFKSQPSRGGVEDDIIFRDITMNHVRWAFDFNLAWRLVGPRLGAAKALTTVHNVQLINCSGTAQTGGTIHGLPGGEFEDLKFVNCHITAQRGLRMDHVLRADTSGLDLKVAEGPMIIQGISQGPTTRP